MDWQRTQQLCEGLLILALALVITLPLLILYKLQEAARSMEP